MVQRVINFIKNLLGLQSHPVQMENLSTLSPEPLTVNLLPPDLAPLGAESQTILVLSAYLFNGSKNLLEKVKITLQEDIQDIIQATPWGLVVMNSQYQLVQLSFLPADTFLMNTKAFPLGFVKNGEALKYQPQDLTPELVLLPKTVTPIIETLKQKAVTYPIITGDYLDYNKKYLTETQLTQLFQSVQSTPVDSLQDSLSVLDQQLGPAAQRVYGHRWNLNAPVYYSESKLAALDRMDLNTHQVWNEAYPAWQTGLVGVIQVNTGLNLLIEIIATGPDYLWVVDRQLAIKLLLAGTSKDQCLLKAQHKILLSEITHFFIAHN
jgi:hypothetical protein